MRESRRTAIRMAAVYALIGIVWIIFSDTLVSTMLPDSLVSSVQSAKGFLFVLLTATVMYALVERLGERLSVEATRSTAAERMLRQVVGTVPVGVLLASGDGTITFLNQAAERLLGAEPGSALGTGVDALIGADDEGTAALAELMRVGAIDGLQVGGRGGAPVRSVVARAAAVDPTQPSTGWVIAIADITEAHQARAEAERLVGAYKFMVDAVDAASRAVDEIGLLKRVAEVAVQSGRYRAAWAVHLDETAHRVADVAEIGLGARALEIAGMMRQRAESDMSRLPFGAGQIMVSNDILRDPANVWRPAALEDGFGSSVTLGIVCDGMLAGGLTLFAAEIGAFDASEIDMLRGLLDALGYQISRIRLARKRLEAETELQNRERGYHGLFEDNPAPMFVFDSESLEFLEVNKATLAKYGYSRDEMMSMTLEQIRPESEMPRLLSVLYDDARYGDMGLWTHRDKAGREFTVHIYSHRIEWERRTAVVVMALEVATVE